MKVRVTVDRDMKVHAAEALTISGPYAVCPTANDVFDSLVGLTIGPGWRRRVTDAIGGRHGCTHITELMGVVGTIAYQTRYGEDARRRRLRSARPAWKRQSREARNAPASWPTAVSLRHRRGLIPSCDDRLSRSA